MLKNKLLILLILLVFSSCKKCENKWLLLPENEKISHCASIKDISSTYNVKYVPYEGFVAQYNSEMLSEMLFIPAEKDFEDVLHDGQIEQISNSKIDKVVFKEVFYDEYTYEQIVEYMLRSYSLITEVTLVKVADSAIPAHESLSQIVKAGTKDVICEIEFLSNHRSTIVRILPVSSPI